MQDRLSIKRPEVNLSDLGAKVRTGLKAITFTEGKALPFAFGVGDALKMAKAAVGHGNWLIWLAAETPLSERSAERYARLATHREHIERHIRHGGSDMSIRRALALIGTANKSNRPRKKSPLVKTAWIAATLDERRAYLASIQLTEWLEAMPADWRAEIISRVDGLRASCGSTNAINMMH
jgi:hypothetical protein